MKRHESRKKPPASASKLELHAAKAWTLRILLSLPLWILAVAAVMRTGVLGNWTDADYLIFADTDALPAFTLPALL